MTPDAFPLLAFDTATPATVVAAAAGPEEGTVRRHDPAPGERPAHATALLALVDEALAAAGLAPADLRRIGVGTGPGSFTGLRIACGLAQGLAFGRGLPVIGVSTLEAIAEESGAPRVLACLDARMGEVYYAALEKRGSRWHEALPVRCVRPDAVPGPPGEGWAGCGDGFAVHADFLEDKVTYLRPEIHPTAIALARLAAPRLAAGEGVDAALAAPLYVREKVAFTRRELEER